VGSLAVIDLEQLLTPVADDSPCGENLRWDPVYDEIKAGRREEDKDALGADGPVQANWTLVFDKSAEVIARRSKDLMLAGYLLEAAVQLHGFAGLRDGLRMMNELLERFWETLYPQIDGDDLEPRAAPVVWFTEADRGARLPNRVREIALTPASDNAPGYSWAFWKSRYVAAKGENEDEAVFAHRRAEADQRAQLFESAAAAAPLAHFAVLREDIDACMAEVKRLQTLLDDRFGRSAPGTSALRQALEECGALVARIFKEKGGQLEGAVADGADEGAAGPGTAGGAAAPALTGPIRSRDDAVRRLIEVAAYFRQAEPHSPVSYLVDRATAWTRMSFEELLGELVKDGGTRDQIGELLGLKRAE
jgi:type VI secretion system protein ImpA